jgi:hypothetical protein
MPFWHDVLNMKYKEKLLNIEVFEERKNKWVDSIRKTSITLTTLL